MLELETWDVERRSARDTRLREHENRGGTGVPRDCDAAVDATGLHGTIEPARDEHDVDVRGESLGASPVCCLASEHRAAVEHCDDAIVGVECYPVTDCRFGVEGDVVAE
jgi:hypothetical protein